MAEWGNPAGRESSHALACESEQTLGTETSQYREEEESIEMPEVAASETGRSPNQSPCGFGVVGPTDALGEVSGSPLERGARDGESPVGDDEVPDVVEFLSNARPE
jgi:hypothetical protein